MIKKLILTLTMALVCGCFGLNGFAQSSAAAAKAAGEIAAAANKFLSSLDDSQRAKTVYKFKAEAQRARWSNLPTQFVKRGGLRLGDLTKPQRDAAMAVVAAALSSQGYEKVIQIVEGDEVLKKTNRGGPGGPAMFGHDEYYISFLGQPSSADPWMIQFGGHHLGINLTLVGERATLAPSHTEVQPAIYEFEGKTVRPLGRETDKSFDMLWMS
jgi:hypothetical protein